MPRSGVPQVRPTTTLQPCGGSILAKWARSFRRPSHLLTHPRTHPPPYEPRTYSLWVTLCGSAYTPYLATPPYQVGHAVLCGARVDRQASGCGGRGRWAATAQVARAGATYDCKGGRQRERALRTRGRECVTLPHLTPDLGLPAARTEIVYTWINLCRVRVYSLLF